MLPDGTYEGLVVDVTTDGADIGGAGGTVLSIVVVNGEHKGQVADVRSASPHDDALDLLGMPCVLVVDGGEPSVVFD